MNTLRPYLAVLSARFQLVLTYRAAALAGFATQCWWGALKIMVYAAFYAGAAEAMPISLRNVITYTWLGQAFLMFLPWAADPDVTAMLRTGAVAYERLRPVDLYSWWYARTLSWIVARVLPRATLMVLTAGVLLPLAGLGAWSLPLPSNLESAILFAVSMIGCAILSASMVVMLNTIVVLTLDERGANLLAAPIGNFLSGSIVPLALLPPALGEALRWQPFAGLVDTPFRIYFGELAGAEAALFIGLQFGWAAVIVALGRWGLSAAMERLQVQGG